MIPVQAYFDMMRVQQALQSKGYSTGKTDGLADDTTRAAIRSFQKDKGLPITGMVDKRTADELGVPHRVAELQLSQILPHKSEPNSHSHCFA